MGTNDLWARRNGYEQRDAPRCARNAGDLECLKRFSALLHGCLVALLTRALICDMNAIRRRMTADELSPAADVWD